MGNLKAKGGEAGVAKPPWSRSFAPKCKNPPRMAAGGFWAEEPTVVKTPYRSGPVNRKLRFLSTGQSLFVTRNWQQQVSFSGHDGVVGQFQRDML
jgi:hypothetical protein